MHVIIVCVIHCAGTALRLFGGSAAVRHEKLCFSSMNPQFSYQSVGVRPSVNREVGPLLLFGMSGIMQVFDSPIEFIKQHT